MVLRSLTPRRDFVIETSWPPDVAWAELQRWVDPPAVGGEKILTFLGTRDPAGTAPFIGQVTGPTQLTFSRRTPTRNLTLPIVRVGVEPSHHGGARVVVAMRPSRIALLVAGVWISGAVLIAAGMLTSSLPDTVGNWLIVMAIPLFAAAISYLPSSTEGLKAERLLREVFAPAPAYPLVETDVPFR